MIADHYRERWEPLTLPNNIIFETSSRIVDNSGKLTEEEVTEFKLLIKKAKQYDIYNSEPACETKSKVDAIISIAKKLGVELDLSDF